jgi:uncharacterized protein
MDDPSTNELLARIAAALERLSPPVTAALPGDATLVWHKDALQPVAAFAPVDIALLTGIDTQKAAVLENGRRLAHGHGAHDILLWGARGSGKSALVKASFAALLAEGLALRLVEASGEDLDSLPVLFDLLRRDTRPAIVFIDDLGFEANNAAARHLRSLLDGGIAARPHHVRLYVTSNRRHILPRNLDEQASAINPRDAADDNLALADRFGLSLGFHVCDQETWLDMVAAYARHLGLDHDPQDALTWAAQRGARSGRVAWHYAIELAGRAGEAARFAQ